MWSRFLATYIDVAESRLRLMFEVLTPPEIIVITEI